MKDKKCNHPPSRYFCGNSLVPNEANNDLIWITWIGCCDCGEIIAEIPLRKGFKK